MDINTLRRVLPSLAIDDRSTIPLCIQFIIEIIHVVFCIEIISTNQKVLNLCHNEVFI